MTPPVFLHAVAALVRTTPAAFVRKLRTAAPALPIALVLSCSSTPAEEPERTTRFGIVGGEADSAPGDHPGVVYLVHDNLGCSGTLIAPNLVLTARHCVSVNLTQTTGCDVFGNSTNGDQVGSDVPADSIQVMTGVNPGAPQAVGAQLFHPPGSILCNADIALIVLSQAIAGITPQKIRTTAPPLIGELGTAVGYGVTSSSGGGGGTRRRRKDVPVISVGQDLNETNLADEITAGQGSCAGDSGGPLISAGDAVISISSRGADCSDPNVHQRYTRLDSHKALIDQAFAAAGATPSLETGTPSAPPKLETGQGPCSTGAECTSLTCTEGTDPVCTQFCSQSPCPAGTQCIDGTVLKGDGSSVDGKICLPLPQGTACEACRSIECVNLVSTCLSSPDCNAALACADGCADDACIAACTDANPAGKTEYDDLADCVCNSSCNDECAHQCGGLPASGGGGGSGASGSGGSSGAPSGGAKNSDPGDSGGCGCQIGERGGSRWWWISLAWIGLWKRRASSRARIKRRIA